MEPNIQSVASEANSTISKGWKNIPVKRAVMVVIVLLVIVAAAYVAKLATGGQKARLAATLQSAQKAASSGDYATAKSDYQQALTLNNAPIVYAALINTISAQGNATGQEAKALKESQPYIDIALKNGGENVTVLMAAGYAYETAGDYQKALTYYTQAVKVAPKSAEAWFHLGHVNQFLGNNSESGKDYSTALSLDPNNPLILIAKGNALQLQGDLQGSYDSFMKASRIVGLSSQLKAEALTGASVVRRGQNNFKYMAESLSLSKEAVDIDPTFVPALATYGFNLCLTNKTSDGIKYLKKAIELNPRMSRNYYQLGIVYRANKDYANSISYNSQAVSRVNQDNTLLGSSQKDAAKGVYLYDLSKTYSLSGSNMDVIPMLTQAVQLNSEVKTYLREDVTAGNFKTISNNPNFLSLINS